MQLSSLPELGFRKGQCFVATEVDQSLFAVVAGIRRLGILTKFGRISKIFEP